MERVNRQLSAVSLRAGSLANVTETSRADEKSDKKWKDLKKRGFTVELCTPLHYS